MRQAAPIAFGSPHAAQALGELAHRVFVLSLQSALALALGTLLARALRHVHAHWSWAALGTLVALPSRTVLGVPTLPLVLLGATATLCGLRWHRLDLALGGDLGRVARARRSPLAILRHRLGSHVGSSAPEAQGLLRLGRERDGRAVAVPFARDVARHTLVVGATGSGKTVTQTKMAVRAVEDGMAAIVIDPKGDRGMCDALRAAARDGGRRFMRWSPTGPSVYNPYARGSESEIADRVLAGERFTEPHYLRQAQRYVGHVVRALRAAGEEATLARIVELLDPPALERLLRELPDERRANAGHAYLDSLGPRQLLDLSGVRDRLAIVAESDVGAWLDPKSSECARFDLLEAAREGAVVYFDLQADGRPLLSRMLGAAIVTDLQSAVAALQGAPAPTIVVIDEFSAIAAEQVVGLFGRARSAGLALLLGTQELSDLRLPGRERLLEQVVGNLSLLIAHRQVVPESAELVSRLGGSAGRWRVSWSSDGRSTRTRESEPLVDPETLQALPPGWAAVLSFGAQRSSRLACVEPLAGVSR